MSVSPSLVYTLLVWPMQTQSLFWLPALCWWLQPSMLSELSTHKYSCQLGTSVWMSDRHLQHLSKCNVRSSSFLSLFIHLYLRSWRMLPPCYPHQKLGSNPGLLPHTQSLPKAYGLELLTISSVSTPLLTPLLLLTLTPSHTDHSDRLQLVPVASFASLQTLPHPASRALVFNSYETYRTRK